MDFSEVNFYHCSFSESLYVGVVLCVVDRGCMHELLPMLPNAYRGEYSNS
jgi:hypothetical protein